MKAIAKKAAALIPALFAAVFVFLFLSPAMINSSAIRAPSLYADDITYNSVTISWNQVNDAQEYTLFRYDSASKFTYTLWNGTGNSCIVSGLKPNTRYYFYVIAYDDEWNEAKSSMLSVITGKNDDAQGRANPTPVLVPSDHLSKLEKSLYNQIKTSEGSAVFKVTLKENESIIRKSVFSELKRKNSMLVVTYGKKSYLFDGTDEDFEPRSVDFRKVYDKEIRAKINSSPEKSTITFTMDQYYYLLSETTMKALKNKESILIIKYGKYKYVFDGALIKSPESVDIKAMAKKDAKADALEETRNKYETYKY